MPEIYEGIETGGIKPNFRNKFEKMLWIIMFEVKMSEVYEEIETGRLNTMYLTKYY